MREGFRWGRLFFVLPIAIGFYLLMIAAPPRLPGYKLLRPHAEQTLPFYMAHACPPPCDGTEAKLAGKCPNPDTGPCVERKCEFTGEMENKVRIQCLPSHRSLLLALPR